MESMNISLEMETAVVEPGERSPVVPREVEVVVPGGRARLLVVDDVEENRQVLGRMLVRHGFAVDVARDGREALSMVEAAKYDAVLLDVMMPEVSGYEVLKTIRRTRSAAELPVIMATVMDSSEEI